MKPQMIRNLFLSVSMGQDRLMDNLVSPPPIIYHLAPKDLWQRRPVDESLGLWYLGNPFTAFHVLPEAFLSFPRFVT